MEIINLILNIAIITAISFCVFWVVSKIKDLERKCDEIENIKVKNIWNKIDNLEEKMNTLKNKNFPE